MLYKKKQKIPNSSDLVHTVYDKNNPENKYIVKANKKHIIINIPFNWPHTIVLCIVALLPVLAMLYPSIKKKFIK
jgi:hypothetical protein